MIQRIQSIYLLVVAILLVVSLCLPLGSYIGADFAVSSLSNWCVSAPAAADGSVARDYAPWALGAILTVVALLNFVTIFLFRHRILQIRMTIFGMVLLVGYYVTMVAFVLMLKGEASFTPSWTVCIPLISLVLDWLAVRAIGKDEVLVKAYDRLR